MAQDFNEKFLDSKSYDYLSLLYDMNLDDTLTAKQIAFSYIKKAKVEKDNFELARGYEQLAYVSPISEALKYIDTTISLTKRSDHIDYPAVGYLFKSYYQFYNEASTSREKEVGDAEEDHVRRVKSGLIHGFIDQSLANMLDRAPTFQCYPETREAARKINPEDPQGRPSQELRNRIFSLRSGFPV